MSSRALNFAALLLLVVLSGSAEEQTTPFAGAKTVGVTAKAVDISGIPHSWPAATSAGLDADQR
ncbi:MAG: hypothetical protein IPI83_02930 [Sphingomonadales bacterium]|nr:hypothetical protein [Sphingomonadales bacterium]